MKKPILTIFAVAAITFILVVGLLAVTGTLTNFLTNVRNLFNPPPDRAQVLSTQTIVTGIQNLSENYSMLPYLPSPLSPLHGERGSKYSAKWLDLSNLSYKFEYSDRLSTYGTTCERERPTR